MPRSRILCTDIIALADRDSASFEESSTVYMSPSAHTLGSSHCSSFDIRLYNFSGKGDQDPSLSPPYAAYLKTQCKSLSDLTTILEMDPGSSLSFDNHYYEILLHHEGLLEPDAALLTDKSSLNVAEKMLISRNFFAEFGQSMRRLGNIQVLTGTEGEIRKKCSGVN
ncbi:Peroxidase 3 [Morella rubra]|uniref:peroxidase n=1 Tax=Morella rubra TaxID=262757 RepID=A0A6A1VN39_9ROSI|nr:Peroxidase 3 [Morella rubra]